MGKLTDKVRPVLLQRYGLRKYGKRIRERGLQAVSYTHLDVYKRQVHSRVNHSAD